MIERRTYSVADVNINNARTYANKIAEELSKAYLKQQDVYFPTHLHNYVEPFIKSTIDKSWDAEKAAKTICEHIADKYSIRTTNEFRSDNFVCIALDNKFNLRKDDFLFLSKFSNRKPEKTLIHIPYDKQAFFIYKPSQSQPEYRKHLKFVESFKRHMAKKYNRKPLQYGRNVRTDFQRFLNETDQVHAFPMVLFVPVHDSQGVAQNIAVYGYKAAVNGNRYGMEWLAYDGEFCAWPDGCKIRKNQLQYLIGL
ncbi:hypothetical protein L596_013130 [Steinernema carpocapsae]|nr:hypothetical protein L596_013130 [Steinernema carpocapsae]